MESLLPYLVAGALIAALLGWWWHFHFWSNSARARRARSPLWLGFSATATSALFLIAGLVGRDLTERSRYFRSAAWTGDVIWWQVVVGVALVPVAIYLLWRGVREVNRELGRV